MQLVLRDRKRSQVWRWGERHGSASVCKRLRGFDLVLVTHRPDILRFGIRLELEEDDVRDTHGLERGMKIEI